MKTIAAIRKHIIFILFLLVIICVSACQPTPEKEIIQHRDDFNELVQNTAEPQASEQPEQSVNESQPATDSEPQPSETPEPLPRYQETLEFENSVFKVFIDAVIEEPNTHIPVVKVEPYTFTQEDAKRAVEFFIQDKPIYEFSFENTYTKDVYQRDIFETESIMARIKSDKTLNEQTRDSLVNTYSSYIDTLEEMSQESSLDLQEWIQVDTKFVDLGHGNKGISVKADMGKVWPANLGMRICSDNSISLMSFCNDGSSFGMSDFYEINDDIPAMETTFSQAQALAEETLNSMGVDNMKLDFVQLYTTPFFMNEQIIESKYAKKCYAFIFTPHVNGLQVHSIKSFSGFDKEGGQEYDSMWREERLWVAIDDTGIIGYAYFYPGKITETVNENVELLEFDKVMDIFEKHISYEGSWTAPNVEYSHMTITKIQMNLFRLRLKDRHEYMYVPVWDFIGNWKTNNYGTQEGKEYSFLTINAIDGTIINRDLGY